jgi:hypothetical protein
MWFGLFVGVMLSFFSTTPGYFSIVTSVLMGAAFFMLFGIVTYAMQRGKRDFTSTSQVVATNYDVVVSFEAAGEARRLLHQLPMSPHDASGAAAGGYTQHDNRHQAPQQPGPQQPGPQSQPPQRPAGWNDPYGQRTPETGGEQAGQYQGGAPQQEGTAGPAQTAPAAEETARPAGRVSGVTYPDLPDGRPQYGVRVTDSDKPAPGQDGQQH